MRPARLLLMFGLAPVALPAQAQDGVYKEWISYCSIGGPSLCASVRVSVEDAGNTLRVQAWNLGGLYGSNPYAAITRIGLTELPSVEDYTEGPNRYFYGTASSSGMLADSDEWATRPWRWTSTSRGFTSWDMEVWDFGSSTTHRDGALISSCGANELPQLSYAPLNRYTSFWATPTCGTDGLSGPYVAGRPDPIVTDGWWETTMVKSYGAPTIENLSNTQLTIGFDSWDPAADSWTRGEVRTADGSLVVASTPEPVSILLLGSGLAAVGLARRRRQKPEGEGSEPT